MVNKATFLRRVAHVLGRILLWPFVGRIVLFLLFGPLLFVPFLLLTSPLDFPENPAVATVTRVNASGTIARKVAYTFEVDGQIYSGQMQWVNLEERPGLRVGTTITVHYLAENPFLSRAEGEPSTGELVWITVATLGIGWGLVFLAALRTTGTAVEVRTHRD